MSGATACTLNCLRTSSTAPKTPPAKKHNCAGSRMRVSLHAECGFLRVKSVEPPVNVPGREDLGQHDGRAQHQVHGGENDRERPLAFRLASGFSIAGEDGDKGDGGGAAHQKIGDHVGQNESGVEGVGLHSAAEQPDDVFDPHQADDARQKCGAISTTVAEKTECACEGRSRSDRASTASVREGWGWRTLLPLVLILPGSHRSAREPRSAIRTRRVFCP